MENNRNFERKALPFPLKQWIDTTLSKISGERKLSKRNFQTLCSLHENLVTEIIIRESDVNQRYRNYTSACQYINRRLHVFRHYKPPLLWTIMHCFQQDFPDADFDEIYSEFRSINPEYKGRESRPEHIVEREAALESKYWLDAIRMQISQMNQ